ncbi:unnamed protein product [Cylicocyclus nassatus]|uniref:Uncharacterized protein n=1 Tax=Cylicocyclus nassatus TaxID=53992 RepID=A0AA36GIB5_CYLNA|nr:unnamed protein product [Cylicocyclus nassatus]
MIYFEDDGTNGEAGIGISTHESEDDFWQELMEICGRVPMANPQDAQADAQPGDTADSNIIYTSKFTNVCICASVNSFYTLTSL